MTKKNNNNYKKIQISYEYNKTKQTKSYYTHCFKLINDKKI